MKFLFLTLFLLSPLAAFAADAVPGTGAGIDWHAILQDPNVFFLLLSGAVYGLLLEFTHPGVILPGLIGGTCLLLAIFALQGMTIDYTGLALTIAGMGLMTAEAFLPAFGALAVGGAVSFVTGAVMLKNSGLGISYGLIGVVTVLNLLVLSYVLSLVMKTHRQKPVTGQEALIGAAAEIVDWTGGNGNVRVAGETWKARAEQDLSLEKGAKVKIIKVDGLTLVVEKGE